MRFQFVRRLEDDALFLNSERKERFLLRRQKSSRPKTRRKRKREERLNAGLFLKKKNVPVRCGRSTRDCFDRRRSLPSSSSVSIYVNKKKKKKNIYVVLVVK